MVVWSASSAYTRVCGSRCVPVVLSQPLPAGMIRGHFPTLPVPARLFRRTGKRAISRSPLPSPSLPFRLVPSPPVPGLFTAPGTPSCLPALPSGLPALPSGLPGRGSLVDRRTLAVLSQNRVSIEQLSGDRGGLLVDDRRPGHRPVGGDTPTGINTVEALVLL